jgi:hypothetical protein
MGEVSVSMHYGIGMPLYGKLHRFCFHLGDKEKEQGRERSVKVSFMLVRFMTLWHLAVIVWEWYTWFAIIVQRFILPTLTKIILLGLVENHLIGILDDRTTLSP